VNRSKLATVVLLLTLGALWTAGSATATPLVWWQIGSGPINYLDDYKTDAGGNYYFEFSENGTSYQIAGIFLVDPDPSVGWGLSAINNSDTPLTFTTGVLNTFLSPVTVDNHVYASYSGSVTDLNGDGVTVTPVGAKIQTTTLNTTTNMGVDVGDAFTVPGGIAGESYDIPASETGPLLGPPGSWTTMELATSFTLSTHDVATLNGFASISPVPEPSTLLLVGFGLLGAAVWKRRKTV
jgi:hypothetical protein